MLETLDLVIKIRQFIKRVRASYLLRSRPGFETAVGILISSRSSLGNTSHLYRDSAIVSTALEYRSLALPPP